MNRLAKELEDDLKGAFYYLENLIVPHYQPIVSLKSRKILGYEGLSRFFLDGKLLPFPVVYGKFKESNLEREFDWFCRKEVIKDFPFKNEYLLFVNILMPSVESDKFGKGLTKQFAEEYGISPENVVLELVESEKVEDVDRLLEVVSYYKKQGFKICLDDFGTGYNTIDMFFKVSPYVDYIKMPIQIVKGVSKSCIKYELLRAFKDIALNLGLEVIAEGVEFEEDLKVLLELGIDHAQGFLIAKPMPKSNVSTSVNLNFPKVNYEGFLASISKWLRKLPEISLSTNRLKELIEKLKEIPKSEKFARLKLKGKDEIYFLNLWEFAILCSDPVKFNLMILRDVGWLMDYAKKNPGLIYSMQQLNRNNQLVDICELTSLLELALKFQKRNIDFFIVLEGGEPKYYLLKEDVYETLYREIYKRRIHVNPLTGLPANVVIEDVVNSLASQGKEFFVGYLDIDNFKAFNDAYGFIKGDLIIKRTAFFLNRFIKEHYGDKGFVGHVGGDDFVFVVECNNKEKLKKVIESMISALENNVKDIFPKEDVERGFFVGKDREGKVRKFPITSFSVAVVDGKGKEGIQEIARVAAKLKKIAKSHYGSKVVFEDETTQET